MLGILVLGVREQFAGAAEFDAGRQLLGECFELVFAGSFIVLEYCGHVRVETRVARLLALQLTPLVALAPLVQLLCRVRAFALVESVVALSI